MLSNSQWTKYYIYHTIGFDPTYCSKTKYCMRQLFVLVTAGCNKQNIAFNNWLWKSQPAVMLQFCNSTAGCYLNYWLLHTTFCLLSVYWIKTNSMIYIPIMFCPLTDLVICALTSLIFQVPAARINLIYIFWSFSSSKAYFSPSVSLPHFDTI